MSAEVVEKIAAQAMTDAIEIRALIETVEAGNNKEITAAINKAKAGRAADHVQRSLFTRMHLIVARHYFPPRDGDLHAKRAFELLKDGTIRDEVADIPELQKELKIAEKLWEKCNKSELLEPFMHFRNKQLAHWAELDHEVPIPLYKEVFDFSRMTAAMLAQLMRATGIAMVSLESQIPAYTESAANFWKPWTQIK